jgi:hypothetical protein
MSTRRRRRLKTNFSAYLDANFPGLIRWPSQEVSGDVALARNFGVSGLDDSSQYPGPELLTDGDMEAVGTTQYISSNSGLITKQTGSPHSGTQVLRVERNGADNAAASVKDILDLGTLDRRVFSGWVRSDGNATASVVSREAGPSFVTLFTSTTSTDWQYFEVESEADRLFYQTNSSVDTEYTEWDDCSARLANPLNGDNNGATIGQPFGGNIPYSYSFDGNNDYVDIYSAALNTAFNGAECTIIPFIKIPTAGIWTDGTFRTSVRVRVDGSNFISLDKSNVNNSFRFLAAGGGTTIQSTKGSLTTLSPAMPAITRSESTDTIRFFWNGIQEGSDFNSIGTWAGNLDPDIVLIGASTKTPTQVWSGLITEVIIHPTRAMTATEIAEIYQWSGI